MHGLITTFESTVEVNNWVHSNGIGFGICKSGPILQDSKNRSWEIWEMQEENLGSLCYTQTN